MTIPIPVSVPSYSYNRSICNILTARSWSGMLAIGGVKKLGLGVMFYGAIIAAIFGSLRCSFVFENSSQSPQLAGEWSCRESLVAVFILNAPVLFPILCVYYIDQPGSQ